MSIIELKVPTIGESVTEVTLSQWLKEDGEYVNMDEALCEFESDKATLEFPSEAAGKLIHVAAEGDDLKIGALIAKIDTSVKSTSSNGSSKEDATSKKDPEEKPSKEEEETKKEHYAEGHPSPAAAKLIKESGVNKEDLKGTGKDGRITKEDVEKAIHQSKEESTKTPKEKTVPSTSKSTQKSTKEFSREDRREKMSRMRRTIAKRLVSAKNNTAMLTTFNEVDLFNVMDLRKQVQDQFVEKYGIKLGFMSLFSKACAKVLMEMPQVNATLDGEELIYHDYVDISIAISTPSGLVVPPVHNVESLPLHEIEHRIKELADKARDGKLSLEEMTGGTFTITNGGVFGSMMSTPIINEPQSAILGMHAIQERPTVINGEIMVRPMMYIALSYDHRVIDGSSSVTFLVKVKEMLEKPGLLLMDL